jgi:hypothetical protein
MSNSIVPVTYQKTSFTGVLPTGTPGMGRIESQQWSQTIYPNGSTVTRIYHNTIEIYDSKGVVNKHNQPNQIDLMV